MSKASQSPKINFVNFTEMLDKYCSYLETYRQTGFEQAIVTATELASELNTRLKRIKRRPGEDAVDEPIIDSKKVWSTVF